MRRQSQKSDSLERFVGPVSLGDPPEAKIAVRVKTGPSRDFGC